MPRRGGNRNRDAARQPSHASPVPPPDSNAALREYFQDHDGFSYNPSNPAWQEFRRLARHLHWGKARAEEKEDFEDALVKTFNNTYGMDESNLESWTALCRVLRITPMPEDLTACLKAVQSVYVNLVDLVDHYRTGKPIRLFATEVELSKYTRRTRKYFPKENAYAGGILKHLLRQIKNPRTKPGVRGTTGRRRRRR